MKSVVNKLREMKLPATIGLFRTARLVLMLQINKASEVKLLGNH